tara:strand:+ start:2935 stop:3408 length:474 start_codon:yes stop_codon:yes gene_type:complete
MGGGVLPVAIHKGKLYFLFSREYINSKDDGGLWSDFGGSKDNDETYFQTALREGFEESDQIIGTKNNIKNLMKNSLQEITINGYRTYVVLIDYNKDLPKKFRNKFLYIKENKPHLLCKKGLYEKDMIKWFTYNEIKKNFDKFRPFYKNIVKTILKLF